MAKAFSSRRCFIRYPQVLAVILISATPTPPLPSLTLPHFASMDTDIGTELFTSYENDFNLIISDLSSKAEGLAEQDGEAKKAAIRAADRAVEEAEEIVCSVSLVETDDPFR